MDGPIILPGLPSAPKKVGLLLSARLKLTSREARPSSPTIGLSELTCIACAVFSAVICSSPFAFGGMNDQSRSYMEPQKLRSDDQHTIDSVGLMNVAREESSLKHVETGHAKAL